MSSSNKVALAKLCKQHYTIDHIRRCLLSRCLSSAFTTIYGRKAKQSIAFGLLLLAGIFTTPLSAQTVDICSRTAQVQTAILAAIPASPICTAVTMAQLAAITGELNLNSVSIGTLLTGDFDGLTGLTTLDLSSNSLSALPVGIFDDLTNLTLLNLFDNSLTTLPADVFDNLTSLTLLSLDSNDLTTLPADVFDNLTSLTELYLGGNSLTTLPADVFDNLINLTLLDLFDNSLTTLPADVFDNLTSLTLLDLGPNSLGTLDADVFDDLTSLTVLDLSENGISALPAGIFDNLTGLTELYLDFNNISTLNADVFDDLTSLTRLDLDFNNISTLNADVFDDLTSLTVLILDNNDLSALPDNLFSALAGLTFLDLDDNNLSTLDADVFDDLTSLTFLDLSGNGLSTLPENLFSALTGLTELYLDVNNLSTLDADVFDDLTSLTRLDLDGNTLTALPDNLFSDLTSLTELHLNDNTFTTPLPSNIFVDLPNDVLIEIDLAPIDFAVALDTSGMITIDLSDAFISRDNTGTDRALSYSAISSNNTAVATVSESGGMLTVTATGNGATTVSVTASDGVSTNAMNAITVTVEMGMDICSRTDAVEAAILAAIPANPTCDAVTMAQLATITGELNLIGMSISTLLSGDFVGLTSLTFLNLFDNSLTTLPADIFDPLTNLTLLSLDSNDLTTLPADIFDPLTNLTELYLGFNSLTTLPAGVFDDLTSLTLLNLFDNSLTTLPADIFDPLTNLTLLDLGDNSLTTLPADVFDNLTNLTFLNLFDNSLTTLPADIFDPLTNLTLLSLDSNDLATLPADVFDNLTSLTELYLGGNSLTTLPADVFDNLINLTLLSLYSNDLTTLPAGIFDPLTSLTFLGLFDNSLTTLPAGIFDNLTNLTELYLSSNMLSTLPANLFNPVSSADIVIDLSPIGDLANVALSVGGTTTINVTNAFISRDIDGDDRPITYTATPANTSVATAIESNGVVTITGAGMGATTVSVTADDTISMFTRDIAVTVEEAGILAFDEATGDTIATVVAAENSGTDTFYVQLASPPANDVTLTLTSSDTNEGTVIPSTLTFTAAGGATPWDTRQAVTVTAVPDDIDRDDSFMVDFEIASAGDGDGANYTNLLNLSSVTVTVTDDDTAGIALFDMATGDDGPTSITTTEGAVTGSFYVALTSQPTGTVTVTIDGIIATEHTLTTPASGILTFTPTGTIVWNTRQEIMLTGVNDDDVDGDQTYDITLTPTGGGYGSVTAPTVSVTNSDDDTAALTITNTTISVNEDVGMAMLEVTLTPAVTAGTVTVDATTTDGTATSADYTAFTSQTLTFAMGTTSQTLNIPINDDSIDEDNEDFTVMLDNLMLPTGLATGDVSITDTTATVTITDDDTVSTTINLSINPQTIVDTADATTITVTATLGTAVVLTTPTDVTVTVGSGSDTATEGTDYGTVPDFTLTIPALSSSGTQTFMIDPDTSSTNGATVTISGAATINSTAATVNSATLTIVEAGILAFEALTGGASINTITIANENNGTDTLHVQLASQPAGNVTLSVTSSDANEGTVTPATLTFTTTNWDDRQALTITAVDDNVDRDGDSFMVDFAVTGGDGVNYINSLDLSGVTVTITDDDTVGLTVDTGDGVTTSETLTPDTFTVVLNTQPTDTVTVEISGLDAGEHSLDPVSGILTFTATDWSNAQTVTLIGENDDLVDGDQTYDLTLTPTGGGYTGVTAPTVSVTNEDDDTAELTIADMSVDEGAGTATVTVTLTPAVTAGNVTVNAMTVDGTATAGEDYTTITSQTLTFAAGSISETLDITISDDSIAEGDETFTVMLDTLVQPTGVTTVSIADADATVTITDDDTAGLSVDTGDGLTTAEGSTASDTFTVVLDSQPTDTVTVTISGLDAGEHSLDPVSGTLTFTTTDWSSPKTVTLSSVDDDFVDDDQAYDLTLTPTGGGYDSVTPETVSITNTDDDTAALSIADMSVDEDAGTATVTVTLTPAVTAGAVMVNAMTVDGTATTAGTDYTAITSQTLTFVAGLISQTLDIPINDDIIAEGDETFTVMLDTLVPPTGVTTVSITDADATVTITDDDVTPTTIALSVNPPTVAETAGATTITVTATLDGTVVLPTATDVMVTISGGTATVTTDYTVTPSTLTITIPAEAANATQTFMITPVDDTTDDNNETVTITGTAGGFTVNPATLTIFEAGILVFESQTSATQISAATITEASSDTFYVELASAPVSDVILTLTSSATNEGTVTPSTLTFTTMNWNARQALTVTAVNDNIDRENDTFMVDFEIATTTDGDGANYTSSLTLPSVTVTVTDDDDTATTTINLSISPDQVTETAGATTITVTATLDGALSTMDTEVVVIVGDSGDTADEGSDYMEIPDFILTIPALMTSSNEVFSMTPITDNENDNEETITISGTATINSNPVTVNSATLTITGFSREEQQVIEQTVAAQASSVTQVVSENIGSFLASRTSAPPSAPSAPAPPAPDGGGGGDVNRENFTSIDWQDWQERFAKLAYEGLKRMDSGADMSLDWALKAAGSDGRLLMPLGVESLTLWAAGGRLKTKGDGMGNYDGGVNSFVVGVDTNLINNWLLGIAASYSDSQVDYTMDGNPIGTTEQNLYSVHPFLSHSLPEHGLTLWVTGGYGVGDIDFSHTTNGEAASDVTQWMAAGGIEKHIITNTLWQGALRLKGLWGNATVDATEYDNGVDIRKVESTFWRARMESEMGYNFQLPGANVRPYALIGGRWDHNDAIVSGDEWHIDIGGGVEVLSGNAFALNISLHTQLTDGDTEEDSIIGTGSLTYDIGHDRQGLQITLSRPLNNTSPSWDQHSFNEVTDKVSGVKSAPLTSELAYGWTVRPFGLEGALQTYVQNSFDSDDRHYAVGLELAVNALTLNFETGYGEADSAGLESMVKTKIRW